MDTSPIKRYFRRLVKNLGYTFYKTSPLPLGLDVCLDISRLANNAASIKTVFDVGANIGQSARRFVEYFPEAKILAFEPIQSTFEILQTNTKHLQQVQCFNYALGNVTEQRGVYIQARSVWNSLVEEVNTPHTPTSEVVNVTTVDAIGQRNGVETIDLLKTDTEGYDLPVLYGAESYIKSGNIKFILVEIGFTETDKRHTFFPALLEYLHSNNYFLFNLYDFWHTPENHLDYANALFIHRGAKLTQPEAVKMETLLDKITMQVKPYV